MDFTTITLFIAAAWLLGAVAVLAVCRAAARGDRVLPSQTPAQRRADSHEHPLAA